MSPFSVLHQLADPVLVVDGGCTVVFANPAMCRLHGREPAGLAGRRCHHLFRGCPLAGCRRPATRCCPQLLAGGDSAAGGNRLLSAGHRQRAYQVSLAPLAEVAGGRRLVVQVWRLRRGWLQMEARLAWETEVNRRLALLAKELLHTDSIRAISHQVLEQALAVTASPYGYVGYIDPATGALVSPTLTGGIWHRCRVPAKDTVFPTFTGLWGWVLRRRRPLRTNDAAADPRSSGSPAGHLPIRRFLAVPAMEGPTLTGQIAVANAPRDYTARDQEALERFAALYALAVQRRHRQARLEASESKYAYLFNHLGDAACILDLEGRIVEVNDPAVARLEVSRDHLLGRPAETFSAPEYREETRAAIARTVATGSHCFETVHLAGSGRRISVEVRARRIDYQGRPALLMLARDISERRQAAARLASARQEWEKTFDAVEDIVTIQDKEMRIVRANRAASRALGLPADRLLGRRCFELFRGAAAPCEGCPVYRTILEGGHHTAEIVHPDQKKVYLVSSSPIRDGEGRLQLVAHFAKDISQLNELEAQLRHAQKLEAVGALAGGVAHDFNNLLTVIMGFLGMAMRRVTQGDPLHQELAQVELAVQRAADLVRQLLLFSRRQPMERKPLRLTAAVTDLLKMLRRVVGEDVTIATALEEEVWWIRGDATNIDQVLINLVVNARDAMPGGGTVTIAVDNVVIGPAACRGNAEARQGRFVRLRVSDTGTGMEPAVLARIFEPFYSTKGKDKGTGLGLAVVYGIVKGHGGWITAHSAVGQGTRFEVYFPVDPSLTPGNRADDGPAGGAALQPRGRGERLLLVEDDREILAMAAAALQEGGYRVAGVASAEEALELVTAQRGGFDLAFIDLILPGMGGLEAADHLAQRDIRILLTTGYSDERVPWAALRRRDYPLLPKPYGVDALLEKVRRVLAGRS